MEIDIAKKNAAHKEKLAAKKSTFIASPFVVTSRFVAALSIMFLLVGCGGGNSPEEGSSPENEAKQPLLPIKFSVEYSNWTGQYVALKNSGDVLIHNTTVTIRNFKGRKVHQFSTGGLEPGNEFTTSTNPLVYCGIYRGDTITLSADGYESLSFTGVGISGKRSIDSD